MKLLTIILSVVVLTASVPAQNVQSTGPFSISISSPSTQIRLGDAIKIEIVLENISDKEITISQSNYTHKGERSFVVRAISATGAAVPLTEYGKVLNGLPAQKPMVIRDSQQPHFLQPHEKLTAEVTLNDIYEFASPGKVFVQAERNIPKNLGGGVVKSNILGLTIVPSSASQE